ncbi:hypothetical protein TWF225_011101 [Orbilia oligospora]|nr:hypothetical protein TWF225_011101 [Orbilia oligospora]KAF3238943.1 hypothetical protein TWF217_001603 [Orbilia oligospora]KAF3242263.1 hypothetical protein TWF128_010516 [Orbilia oligospora]KAF3282615.1 hypothetical protein TWF132_010632 [Orbilia oligospora]
MHQHFVEDLKSPAGLSAQSPGPSDEYEAKFVFVAIRSSRAICNPINPLLPYNAEYAD